MPTPCSSPSSVHFLARHASPLAVAHRGWFVHVLSTLSVHDFSYLLVEPRTRNYFVPQEEKEESMFCVAQTLGSSDAGEEEWSSKSEEECVEELVRRSRHWSVFRADRLRLPVASAEKLSQGDRVQCFHDHHTGYHDWVRLSQGWRSELWRVELLEWRERDGELRPPVIRSLGELLETYQELRINNTPRKFLRRTEKKRKERFPPSSALFTIDEGDSWLDKTNEDCFLELDRRCKMNASWRLRFRLPTGVSRRPTPGCVLQLFHDRLTGFATYGTLLYDDNDAFVRIYADHANKTQQIEEEEEQGGQHNNNKKAFVDIPLGIVLDQHAELRVIYAAATLGDDNDEGVR